jgi:hypothetical protein
MLRITRACAALGVVALLQIVASCSADDGAEPSPATGGGGGASGFGGGSGSSGDASIIASGGSGAAECGPTTPCAAGVCVNGKCCPTVESACGARCCSGSEVCLFEQCLLPGKACQAVADCAEGEYCETALGDAPGAAGAGGSAGSGGKICTQPVPANGRCVPLPPVCDESGNGPDGGPCFEQCEYRPPAGKLDAVVKWQWGQQIPAREMPNQIDVWSTPTVGRVVDANCDGKVDESDPPNVIFVSANVGTTQCAGAANRQADGTTVCQRGRLRVLDGRSGEEIWTLARPDASSLGFAGASVALGDVDGDGKTDIVAMTGEGKVALVNADGQVVRVSDLPIDQAPTGNFGWGGGVALGDMDGDGHPEIAFGRCLFDTKNGAITRLWCGSGGNGGGGGRQLSFFADLDGDGKQELVAGNTAYRYDGSALWTASAGGNGFNAVADFDGDGKPEVVLVENGNVRLLEGATGVMELGPVKLSSTGFGGPPTVADFDGDGKPEIGVAQQDKYSMLKPDYAGSKIDIVWEAPNHDLSSSVTGSSVFDFNGDGRAEVVYNDECFLWVWDGKSGEVLFAGFTSSFTGTEASIVADVDGDGRAEIVMGSNGVDMSSSGWKCNVAPWNQPDPATGRPGWAPPAGAAAYRGITVWGDRQNSWVGTRTIWNQHAYSVSNVCDSRDSACDPPNAYGAIPQKQKDNWNVAWLNNFRQNVQDRGLFDAPDATVSIVVECKSPPVVQVSIRNVGLASLPAGVSVAVLAEVGGTEKLLGTVTTSSPLLPGQTQVLPFSVPSGAAGSSDLFFARIEQDPANKTFNECREDNNQSGKVRATCGPR